MKGKSHQSYKSFENLVALANAQEKLSWNSTKKFVWRETGDAPVLIESLKGCLEHGLKGGARAFALAYGIRSGINIFLVLFTIARFPKRFRFALVRKAVFGPDSFRFGAMIGCFVAAYKTILNSAPILALRLDSSQQGSDRHSNLEKPGPSSVGRSSPIPDESLYLSLASLESGHTSHNFTPSTPSSPSSSADPSPQPPHLSSSTKSSLALAREKGLYFKPWHAALAGSVSAAFAVLLEKEDHRSAVGQQMLVRGLQGAYNIWSQRTSIQIPYGSVVTFVFCCGQILYAYLLKPHTISAGYDSWIQSMSIAPLEAIKINRALVLEGKYDTKLLETVVDGKSRPWNGVNSIITPHNRKRMLEQLGEAIRGNFGPRIVACNVLHPHHDRCIPNAFIRIIEVAKLLMPVYGALHFIPMILFKRGAVMKQPLKMFLRAALGALRSSTFIGIFVFIFQANFCLLRNLHNTSLSPLAAAIVKSKFAWWIGGCLSGLSLLFEHPQRREELAMYCLPKAGESAWLLFRGEVLGIDKRRKGAWKADSALSAAGMGLVMTIYQTNPGALSSFVRRVLYQFIGPN